MSAVLRLSFRDIRPYGGRADPPSSASAKRPIPHHLAIRLSTPYNRPKGRSAYRPLCRCPERRLARLPEGEDEA